MYNCVMIELNWYDSTGNIALLRSYPRQPPEGAVACHFHYNRVVASFLLITHVQVPILVALMWNKA